jgi:DNA-binding transcriptional ArsR family regulator
MSKDPNPAVAEIFFALGAETRLSVLSRLGAGALSATALSSGARVTRQAIVKHLRVLESAGLITHEKQGREVLCTLEGGRIDEARAFLEVISARWDRALDRLREMIEKEPPRLPKKRLRR